MPPLRKKGRGGGGGKTEAPLPGQVPGVSPSVSASLAKKEREKTRNASAQAGLENLGVFVSRSFQKEKSEKKLLETSRTSLHLTSGISQRSLRVASRRAESTSTDGTPRLADSSSRREEKRFGDASAAQRTGAGYKSACRSRDESAACRTSCRELGDDKALYRRSGKAPGEEKLERRVSRREDKSVEFSTRSNNTYPGISGGKVARESKSVDATSTRIGIGGSSSQRVERFEDFIHHNTSPISPAYVRKSPRHSDMVIVSSPTVNLPVKSSCKCGVFRSSDVSSSPPTQQHQDKLGIIGLGKQRGASPILMPTNTEIVRIDGKERRSRDFAENGVMTPTLIPLQHSASSGSSGSRSNTPSNVLHGRLAILEGRVSQIAAELKATKELLDANNPACSKAVLSDIQTKIHGIERAINYRLAKECGLVDQLQAQELRGHYITANDGSSHPHSLDGSSKISGRGSKSVSNTDLVLHGQGMYGTASNASLNSGRALAIIGNISPDVTTSMSAAEKLSHLASLALPRSKESNIYQCIDPNFPVEVGGSAPSTQVKPVFDHNEFEDRLYPHQKLLKNRPGVQQKLMENRAALQQKLMENSVLLRHKLAALEERDGISSSLLEDGELGAAKFINSLKQGVGKDKEYERGKCIPSEFVKTSATEFVMGEIEGPFPEKCMNYQGETSSQPKSRAPKEMRRTSSSSRKSFSGTPGGRNEARFHPLEKGSGSRVASERRRRSSEKRKSIGSPEIVTGASQIVMLEPTQKIVGTSIGNSSTSQTLAIQHYQRSVEIEEVIPTCAEPRAPNLSLADENHTSTEDRACEPEPDVPSNTSNSPLRLLCDEAIRTSLACDESLTSDDTADEPECAPPEEDDEQPYLAECEDNVPSERMHQVGDKIATAGWFMGDGDAILLAHDDGYCSFYDVLNMEGKANYKGPENLSSGTWRDCWLIRAAGSDGTSNKYIVAASAGSAVDAAFCSWDFYDRSLTAYHSETASIHPSGNSSFKSSPSSSPERRRFTSDEKQKAKFTWYGGSENDQLLKGKAHNRPLSDVNSGGSFTTNSLCRSDGELSDTPLWWYRPSSPLIAAAGTGLKTVTLYDVRDGDVVMRWDLGKWVACMDFCSPVQWRNRSRLVVAEDHALSLWDVSGMTPHPVSQISLGGKQIRALHIRNSDAEASGGVRQRVSSRDGLAVDGVVCTQDSVNILDFRVAAGIVLKIPTFGDYTHSVAVNGDLVFAGATSSSNRSSRDNADGGGIGSYKESIQAKILQWSIKQGRPMSVYNFPLSPAHQAQQSVAQVWGNDNTVMGVNGNGLFMFESTKGTVGREGDQAIRETLGTDDLYQPAFDFAGSRVLLISRDRPASWCHWP
ncbi:hypothetical protein R1flu_026871 [Riccia fluitans]|uniref:At4g14310 8-bladed propeller domain-containing protein n=1 Tax=Riccia fluitans TaxID=41844 RepID=A0ABD1XHW9_9MARC